MAVIFTPGGPMTVRDPFDVPYKSGGGGGGGFGGAGVPPPAPPKLVAPPKPIPKPVPIPTQTELRDRDISQRYKDTTTSAGRQEWKERELERIEERLQAEIESKIKRERERLGISEDTPFGATQPERDVQSALEFYREVEGVEKLTPQQLAKKKLFEEAGFEQPAIEKAAGILPAYYTQKIKRMDARIKEPLLESLKTRVVRGAKDFYETGLLGKRKDKPLIVEPIPPEFQKVTSQTGKETLIVMPDFPTQILPSAVMSKPSLSLFEQQKMEVGESLLKIRKKYGEIFEKEPSMEPLTIGGVAADVGRTAIITAPEWSGRVLGTGTEILTPEFPIIFKSVEIPMRQTVSVLPPGIDKTYYITAEPPKTAEQVFSSKEIARGVGELVGELGYYAVLPSKVLFGAGLAVATAPKGKATTQERIIGGTLAGLGLGRPIRKIIGEITEPFRTKIRVTEETFIPKQYTPKAYISKPSKKGVSDVLVETVYTAPGRRVKVELVSPFKEFFGLKPKKIYEGIPYGKGREQYKKALEQLSWTGLTEGQTKEAIRLQKTIIEPRSFGGQVVAVGEENPFFVTAGMKVTARPKFKLGDVQTAGGKIKIDFIAGKTKKINLLLEKEGVEYYGVVGREYNPLGKLGKKTKRFGELSGMRYVGERPTGSLADQEFFGETVSKYLEKGIVKPLAPGGRSYVGKTAEIYAPGGKGIPESVVESNILILKPKTTTPAQKKAQIELGKSVLEIIKPKTIRKPSQITKVTTEQPAVSIKPVSLQVSSQVVGVKGKQKDEIRIKTSLVPSESQVQKPKLRLITGLETRTEERLKTAGIVSPIEREETKIMEGQLQRESQRFAMKLKLRSEERQRPIGQIPLPRQRQKPRPPKERYWRPPIPPPPIEAGAKGKLVKIERKEPELVVPFVRRYGKFQPVSKPVAKEKAIKVGVGRLRRTLAATLQLRKPSGEVIPFAKETREFRIGKAGLIQRAPLRLGMREEVAEIIRSRKGGIKFIS